MGQFSILKPERLADRQDNVPDPPVHLVHYSHQMSWGSDGRVRRGLLGVVDTNLRSLSWEVYIVISMNESIEQFIINQLIKRESSKVNALCSLFP